jgi:hypothetical protein
MQYFLSSVQEYLRTVFNNRSLVLSEPPETTRNARYCVPNLHPSLQYRLYSGISGTRVKIYVCPPSGWCREKLPVPILQLSFEILQGRY